MSMVQENETTLSGRRNKNKPPIYEGPADCRIEGATGEISGNHSKAAEGIGAPANKIGRIGACREMPGRTLCTPEMGGETEEAGAQGVAALGTILIYSYDKVIVGQLAAESPLLVGEGREAGVRCMVPDIRGISEAILWTNFFNFGIALYLTALWRARMK